VSENNVVTTISDFEKIIKKENILLKYNLERIGVFGSFARGETANDIDICIEPVDCNYTYLDRLREELATLTGMKIDIMIKKYANPVVIYRTNKDMIYVTA